MLPEVTDCMIDRKLKSRWTTGVLTVALLAVTALCAVGKEAAPAESYFPPRGEWRKQDPAAAGFDKAKLDEAIAFALAHENPNTKDLAVAIPEQFRNEAPYNTLIGPTQPRGGCNGIIIHRGTVVAEWGDTARADMTFSVTKTFLSTVVGVAFDQRKIRDVTDRVATYMPKGVDLFTSEHNAPITWDHLLRQTSDWSGTLWGKPDWADRPPKGQTPEQWAKREMHQPGTFYKYNDARINVLALSALYVFKRPLPDVLKESIMDPIGASSTWHWEGYDNCLGGDRRQTNEIGEWRRTFWRRHVHQRARPRAFRLPVPPPRQMEQSPAHLREVDQPGPNARSGESDLRLLQLVSEHSIEEFGRHGAPTPIPVDATVLRHVSGQRSEYCLSRLG